MNGYIQNIDSPGWSGVLLSHARAAVSAMTEAGTQAKALIVRWIEDEDDPFESGVAILIQDADTEDQADATPIGWGMTYREAMMMLKGMIGAGGAC